MKRIILFILTIPLFLYTKAQSSIVACEYWMDGDMDVITEVPVTGNEASFAIDVSGLSNGMHTLYYRVRDDQGRYSTPNTWLYMKDSALRANGSDTEASTIVACEYWMDGDMSNITEIAVDSTQVAFAIDVTSLADGMHTLYYRIRDGQGRYSTPNTWLYMKDSALRGNDTEPSAIVACEYWMDGDMSNITEIAVDSSQVAFAIDVTSLSDGMHTLYYRVRDDQGRYSTPNTWLYMKDSALRANDSDTESSTIVACEYWMDGDMSNITEIAVDSSQVAFAIDVTNLADGMHTLYYRVRDDQGRYSTPNTWLYMKDSALRGSSNDSESSTIVACEYWMDGDMSHITEIAVDSTQVAFVIDVTSLADGMHTLYYRVRDDQGRYSTPNTWLYMKDSAIRNSEESRITWYKYWWNHHQDMAVKVEVESDSTEYVLLTELEIPDYVRVEGDTCNTKATLMFMFGNNKGYTSGVDSTEVIIPLSYYVVTYMIDGEVYHRDSVPPGKDIEVIEHPVREGYTFSGWSEAPKNMPLHDVTITGSFAVNSYAITYVVDGEEYYADSIAYGTELIAIEDPVKEGHTFSGWSEIPKSMPAKDVEVVGSFTINDYQLTYTLDGEVYYTETITYGTELTAIASPTKEGYTFSGWSEVPETMPAGDVTVVGLFILNTMQTDEQGLIYELNATKDAFEVSGYTDDLVSDVVIASELYGLPVNAIKVRALALADNMKSLVIPASIKSIGKNSLGANESLLTIDWNTTASVDAKYFSRPSIYGNMLVYVADATTQVTFQGNVVIDGVIDQLTLTDEYPFRNTRNFTARKIALVKNLNKKTKIGVSGGWEAMVLPFDVQSVVSKNRGELKPFGEADFTTSLPYWLGELQADGTFAATNSITANKPFIMQLPNSDEYEDRYNVEGEVTFSATNVTVYPTIDMEQEAGNGYVMFGSYEGTTADSHVYALNDEEYTADGDTYMPGGVFVANSRDIRPFEAYVYTTNAGRAPYLRIGKETTGVVLSTVNGQQTTEIYDLTGRKVLNTENLKGGVYIVNGKKVVIK